MSLTVREILQAEYFWDFEVIAGEEGIDKQIQGIAILDAPDGFEWTRGKELVISSGYIFHHRPNLLEEYIRTDFFKEISGLGLKMDRYIKTIPKDILKVFDELKIPLIRVPSSPSWMEIMNELNVLVMNKNIRRYTIGSINPRNFADLSYQERKINKILSQIEGQMKFPAMLYDISKEKPYYSSPYFLEIMDDLVLEDLWNPSMQVSKHVLCDNLDMVRYRIHDKKYENPYSWVRVPIIVGQKLRAYFVIVEAVGLIDYFEQFTLRIGFLLLQSLYEQIIVVQSIGDIGFEKFIGDIINNILLGNKITKKALELGIDVNKDYYIVLMRQEREEVQLASYKGELRQIISSSISNINARMAMIDDNSCIFLLPEDPRISRKESLKKKEESSKILYRRIKKKIEKSNLIFALSDEPGPISDIKKNYERCERTLKVGSILYPEESYLKYSDLGIFAWMDIDEEEFDIINEDIEVVLNDPEGEELLEILKVYLQSNMNYSLTAKELYIHINTVRNRIDYIKGLIDLDIEDPMNRLKLETLLIFNK